MAAIYQAVYRRASSLVCRLYSTYVRKMRYLNELKEDDSLCRQAQTSGTFYLFHNLSPFLQNVGKKYLVPQLSAAEMKRILEKFKETEQWIEKSVLIGCSDEHVPHFALDLGALEKSVIESELKGSFTDLRKALFVVDGKDSPLLASAQSLLRWHDSHQYCSKTGQPTQKNVAGSKRVCHASGIIYYPQMSPVVITLVSDGSRCLLARQPSFPQGMYTALSGFCDMGENVEETVRREVAEEVGLEVESLQYSASQHWPFPSSCLMIACHALVRAQQISMNSLELEEARWFGLEEIVEGLKREPRSSKRDDGSFLPWFPPKQAIAHQLICEWVKQRTSQPAYA
ncbi:PREDICTED: nucleoside diphosphate-linked moiety X motif 13 [Cariama cristata]|uniref:nucleoside diphosphate-linked moiety X motif 13 n=1 Tax=Cariama cristata TaxID=54380 RepID=UPI000520B5BB|nr:PREDICTED: nucleoside diphosphate-linked moiety X motif 13 [Cariama cristata]